jgi:hypothetical protein
MLWTIFVVLLVLWLLGLVTSTSMGVLSTTDQPEFLYHGE